MDFGPYGACSIFLLVGDVPTGDNVMCVNLIKRHSDFAIIFFLIVVIFIVTGTHLLPALELFGVFFGAVVINNYLLFSGPRHQRLKMHMWYLAAVIVAAASVFLNPAFTAMREISKHNGGMDLTNISSTLYRLENSFT